MLEYDGPSEGLGAKSAWTNGGKEAGRMEIVECLPPNGSRPGTLSYRLDMESFGTSKGQFVVSKPVTRTEVVWSFSGTHSGSAVDKAVSKWFMIIFKRQIEKDFEESLQGLKEKLNG